MKWIGYLFTLLFGIVFLLLGVFNFELVEFSYVQGAIKLPLVVVMVGGVVFGALWVWVILGMRVVFWRRKAKRLEAEKARAIARLKEEAAEVTA